MTYHIPTHMGLTARSNRLAQRLTLAIIYANKMIRKYHPELVPLNAF